MSVLMPICIRASHGHDAEKTRQHAVFIKYLILLLLYLKCLTFYTLDYVDCPYNLSLRDIVEENEVTKHGDEADETKTSNNIDDSVFQIKFS